MEQISNFVPSTVLILGYFVNFDALKFLRVLLSFVALSLSTQAINAQTESTDRNAVATTSAQGEVLHIDDKSSDDWTFYHDHKNKVMNIDFARLGGRLARLQIRSGEDRVVVHTEDLMDIPANSIYEVDLSMLSAGTYTLEVYSLKDLFKTEFTTK